MINIEEFFNKVNSFEQYPDTVDYIYNTLDNLFIETFHIDNKIDNIQIIKEILNQAYTFTVNHKKFATFGLSILLITNPYKNYFKEERKNLAQQLFNFVKDLDGIDQANNLINGFI